MKYNKNIGYEVAKTLRLGYALYELNLVHRKIGFENPSSLSKWLKENNFVNWEGIPSRFFMINGYMNYSLEIIYWKPIYGCCSEIINGSEFDIGRAERHIVTTLISKKGVEFLKKLIGDFEMTQKISAEIRLQIERDLFY